MSEPGLAQRYRKKLVVIEAMRVADALYAAKTEWRWLPAWLNEAYEAGEVVFLANEVLVRTLEGEMRAGRGDWLIRGVQGELYPCKPEIFEATYEPIDRQYLVVVPQIVGSPADYVMTYDSDGRRFDDRQEALDAGLEALGHDDFCIATLDGGKLVAYGFGMDDFEPEDRADLAEIGRQLGIEVNESAEVASG